jgi:hypothetical protein
MIHYVISVLDFEHIPLFNRPISYFFRRNLLPWLGMRVPPLHDKRRSLALCQVQIRVGRPPAGPANQLTAHLYNQAITHSHFFFYVNFLYNAIGSQIFWLKFFSKKPCSRGQLFIKDKYHS